MVLARSDYYLDPAATLSASTVIPKGFLGEDIG